MSNQDFKQTRIKNVEERLSNLYKLLNDYETELTSEEDAKLKMKIENNINDLMQNIEKAEKELDKLQQTTDKDNNSETNEKPENLNKPTKTIQIVASSPKNYKEQGLFNQLDVLVKAQKANNKLFREPEEEKKCEGFTHIRKLISENFKQEKNVGILHVSVHGKDFPNCLIFEDKENNSKLQYLEDATDCFELLNEKEIEVETVILSACHSAAFAQKISEITQGYAVGMNTAILSEAAVLFLNGFYNEYLNGENIKIAFKAGKSEIGTMISNEGVEQKSIPQLYFKGELVF
jgi:cysteinyl-tRNA synthetase